MSYFKDIINQEYELAAARGILPGITTIHKFGKNPDLDGSAETLWSGGGLYTGFSTSAERVRIKSGGAAADTIAGTGAQKVTIYGLDGSGVEISEEVDTAGASASLYTTATFKRAWRAIVTQVGSGGKNVGTITIEQETSGDIMSAMPAGTNRTHILAWTVPAGKTLYMHSLTLTSTAQANTNTQFDLFIDTGGQGIFESRQPISAVEGGGQYSRPLDWVAIPENSDIDVRCTSTTGTNVVSSGGFHGILIDN